MAKKRGQENNQQENQHAQEAQQDEAAQLMQLSFKDIFNLPEDKRQLVYKELERQAGTYKIPDGVIAGLDKLKGYQTQAEALQAAISEYTEGVADRLTAVYKGIEILFSEDKINSSVPELTERLEYLKQIYPILQPYIEQLIAEDPEGYAKLSFPEGIEEAAKLARANGVDIPKMLQESERRQHIKDAHKRRELAAEKGIQTNNYNYTATLTSKDDIGYNYFTSVAIAIIPGIEDYILEDGKINLYSLNQTGKDLQEVDKLHTGFLMYLLRQAFLNTDFRETNSTNAIIPIYLPAAMAAWGIDPRQRLHEHNSNTGKREFIKRDIQKDEKNLAILRRDKFMEILQPFSEMAGFYGNDLYRIATLHHYEAETETAYIIAPYMFKLVEYALLHADKHGAIKNIFHADIMTENQAAVEIANRIAMGVIARGVTRSDPDTYRGNRQKPTKRITTKTLPSGERTTTTEFFKEEQQPVILTPRPRKISYPVSFSRLISDCPQLKREIESIREGSAPDKSQRINKKLKDTFNAAIRIIMEKSDMPRYYKDFTIKTGNFSTFRAPTNSTLSEKLIISHNGKNPDFTE